jgi:hypothetical protein
MNRRSFLRTLIAVPFVGAALYSGVERLVVKPYIRMTGAPYFSEWQEMPTHLIYAAKWLQWCEIDGRAQVVLVPILISRQSLFNQPSDEARLSLVTAAIENGYNSLVDHVEITSGRPYSWGPPPTHDRYVEFALPLARIGSSHHA